MKRSIIIPILIISGACMVTGCNSKKYQEIDLSGIHTTAAVKETLASTTAAPATEAETTTAAKDTVVSISADIETYKSQTADHLTIQYPVVANMNDAAKQKTVNELLKTNATAIEASLGTLDPDVTVDIRCKVISLDRSRITAVYTGSYTTTGGAYPVNVFYTNTIDLSEARSLGFDDYSDAYTMAGYVMSDDCEFHNVSGDLKQELLDYRKTQSLEIYTELFTDADFPLKEGNSTFPESFSYVDQSVLYFSIPVPHALGDYALVKFTLDGK